MRGSYTTAARLAVGSEPPSSLAYTRPSMGFPKQHEVVPSVMTLDGFELAPLEPHHAPQILQLLAQRGNRFILELNDNEDEVAALVAELMRTPWALPLAVLRGEHCVGIATTALPNVKSLNSSLLALFTQPSGSTIPFALFLRHVFWNFPVRRLYSHIPAFDLTQEYLDLYRSVGFVEEGRLYQHATVAGHSVDVAAFGLLRSDFESWCEVHEPRLGLS
jgi:hypothetical protein